MREFYGLAAQVIPVFLLAGAIESRAFGRDRERELFWRRRWVWILFANVVLIMAGEVGAFYAVGTGTSSPLLVILVSGGLVASAWLFLVPLLVPWIMSLS